MTRIILFILGALAGGTLFTRLLRRPITYQPAPLFIHERPVLWTHKRMLLKTMQLWPG